MINEEEDNKVQEYLESLGVEGLTHMALAMDHLEHNGFVIRSEEYDNKVAEAIRELEEALKPFNVDAEDVSKKSTDVNDIIKEIMNGWIKYLDENPATIIEKEAPPCLVDICKGVKPKPFEVAIPKVVNSSLKYHYIHTPDRDPNQIVTVATQVYKDRLYMGFAFCKKKGAKGADPFCKRDGRECAKNRMGLNGPKWHGYDRSYNCEFSGNSAVDIIKIWPSIFKPDRWTGTELWMEDNYGLVAWQGNRW